MWWKSRVECVIGEAFSVMSIDFYVLCQVERGGKDGF